jgi:hypothetical protein
MQTVDHWIWIIGTGIDLFGVVILLAAIGWTSHLFVKGSMGEQLCTFSNNSFWLISVQLLDGVGAGIFGALMPLVIADLMRGTGRRCYRGSCSGEVGIAWQPIR